jgi:hypothetical protein
VTSPVGHMSLREYARRRQEAGLRPSSLKGIQDAIAAGRIKAALAHVPGKMGRMEAKVTNPDLADRELAGTANPAQELRQDAAAEALAAGSARILPGGPVPAAAATDAAAELARERADYAALRRQAVEADIQGKSASARLKAATAAKTLGELVPAADVDRRQAQLARMVTDRLNLYGVQVGRYVALTLSLEEDRVIAAVKAANVQFLRDLSNEVLSHAQSANAATAAA